MGFWSFYFIAKLAAFYAGAIGFHLALNFALAVLVALPLAKPLWRYLRLLLAVPAGIGLLYFDSFLPPISRLMQTLPEMLTFSADYIAELLLRFVHVPSLLAGTALLLLWLLLAHRLRMSSFVFIGMLTVPLVPIIKNLTLNAPGQEIAVAAPGSNEPTQLLGNDTLTARLNEFYAAGKLRKVRFPQLEGETAVDVLVLQICSLGWDDMAYVDQQNDRLIGRFDVLFTRFNSAASYSGPAAMRLLRSNCGQVPHEQLYQPAPSECEMMSNLAQSGFQPQWLMNHSGKFGDFRGDIARNLGVDIPMEIDTGAAIGQRAFDNEPIYDDYDILTRWWQRRLANPSPRVALYYSGISLHDGNRAEGLSRDARESYRKRLSTFLTGINRFLDVVAQSGRRAIVVLVPEHGAAVRGDRVQISGLREIPTPAITQVPVGIKVFGPDLPAIPQQIVDAPSSYIGLSELLSRILGDAVFSDPRQTLAHALEDLPQTESVSENEGIVVMKVGNTTQMRTPDGNWSQLDVALDKP